MGVARLCWALGHTGHLLLDEPPRQNAVDLGFQLPRNMTSLFQWVHLRPVQQLCPLLVKHQSQKALRRTAGSSPWPLGVPPTLLWGPRKAGLTGDILSSGQRQAEASTSLMHRDQEVLDENQRRRGRVELLEAAAPVKVHEVFWPVPTA